MKDFTEMSTIITKAKADLDNLLAEFHKVTGMRYDDKALEMACRYLAENYGSCPAYRAREPYFKCPDIRLCTTSWQCWMKYFRGKE